GTSACFDWRGVAAAVFATWVGLIRLRGARAGLFCCCLTVLLPARRVCFRGPLVFAVPALADVFIRTSSGVRRRLAPSLPEAPPTRSVRAVAPGGSEHVAGGMGMDARMGATSQGPFRANRLLFLPILLLSCRYLNR